MSEAAETFEGWAILELMGHRKLAGFVRSVQLSGAPLIRIDVSDEDGEVATQFYAPGALYCITPTTEALAKSISKSSRPAPVTRWELPPAREADDDPGGSPGIIDDVEDDEACPHGQDLNLDCPACENASGGGA